MSPHAQQLHCSINEQVQANPRVVRQTSITWTSPLLEWSDLLRMTGFLLKNDVESLLSPITVSTSQRLGHQIVSSPRLALEFTTCAYLLQVEARIWISHLPLGEKRSQLSVIPGALITRCGHTERKSQDTVLKYTSYAIRWGHVDGKIKKLPSKHRFSVFENISQIMGCFCIYRKTRLVLEKRILSASKNRK